MADRLIGRSVVLLAGLPVIIMTRLLSVAFRVGALTLRGQAFLSGAPSWFGIASGCIDAQCLSQPCDEALERNLSIAGLRPTIGRDRAHDRAKSSDDQRPLTRRQRRGIAHIEDDLNSSIGGIGVLAAGTTGTTDPPLELPRVKGRSRANPDPSAEHTVERSGRGPRRLPSFLLNHQR